jgi:hypothetical protein
MATRGLPYHREGNKNKWKGLRINVPKDFFVAAVGRTAILC